MNTYNCYAWCQSFFHLLHRKEPLPVLAGEVYDVTMSTSEFKPRTIKPHPQLNFLRGTPVFECIEDLINHGLYPQKVRVHNMPNDIEWHNYDVVVIRTFHATYYVKNYILVACEFYNQKITSSGSIM